MNTPIASDTSPPSKPLDLAATEASDTQIKIDLAWKASDDNIGVTNYLVERCAGVGCVNFAQQALSPGTAYTDTTGLTANTIYNYRVQAVDGSGNLSVYSDFAAAVAQAPDTVAPSAPTGLTATDAGRTKVDLAWSASSDNIGVTNYLVERCAGAGCVNFAQQALSPGTAYSDTMGLVPNTHYRYRVRAVDAAVNPSGFSTIVSVNTSAGYPILPRVPVSPTAVAASSEEINLSWSVSTAPRTYFQPFGQGIHAGNATTYTITGLASGIRYYFALTAIGASNNESSYSNEVFKVIP
jgi:chitodextrinase